MPHGGEGKGLHLHRLSGEMKGDSPSGSYKRLLLRNGRLMRRGRGRRIGESAPDEKACPAGRAFVKSYGHGDWQDIERLDIFRSGRR